MLKEEANRNGTHFFRRLVLVAGVMISILIAAQLLVVDSADAAGFSTEPPAGDSLLEDYFGVNPELISQGGGRYSFDRDSLIPANPSEVGWTEIDWYGSWSFDDWETTTVWGTVPSGGEWYDVEAMYVDNDADNIYVAIITSCPFSKPDWGSEPGISGSPTGLGIYEPRYEGYPIYPWVMPGDLCIDLGLQPRDEKGTLATSYDYGLDIVHERRNPKDGDGPAIWKDSTQHTISSIRDTNVGYKLYKTTADPGGYSIGDPYIDLGTSPKYDWYTASIHAVSEWQHTNFDPFSTWGTQPSARGDATVYYYKYEFPGGIRENNADTYVIEATIPRSLFGTDNPAPGETLGIQWVTGCRNEGVTTASISTQISGIIGNFVWNDEDEDGCQDVGEDGIEGVTVELYQSGGGSPIATDVTDSDGFYSFDADAGDYYIRFVKPTGWIFTSKDACGDTSDSDADATGETDVFTFNPTFSDPDDLTRDAGLYGERAEIGDLVWRDTDGDGKQDSGEPGIGGVTVKLFESGNPTPVATTTTASDGSYLFETSPGDYYVTFTAPSGYFFTIKDVSGNTFDLIDSDAGSSGMTAVTTLTAGEQDHSWDCGLFVKGTIGDFVWEDLDGDGIQDPGEPGIEGIFVNLYKWGGAYLGSTSTDADGLYSFTVVPGNYYVKFNPGSQYSYSPRDVGNDAKDSDADATGKTAQITITSGETELKWDAGLIREASLGDYVWEDFDGDGVQDPGETGLSGIQVELYESGNPTPIATDTTDGNGAYLFDGLLPGDYYVVVPLPADYFYSPRYQDGYELDSNVNATGYSEIVSLSSGETNLSIDAGLMPRPETRKEFYGTIYYNGILTHHLTAVDNEYEEYITPDTIIYLNYTNPDVLNQTIYRIWRMDPVHDEWVLLFDWMNTTTGAGLGYYPINLSAIGAEYGYPCSGLYQIEFYSIDIYGNVESLLWNNVYVDCTPPTSLKTYGDPSVTAWDRQEWIHWIGPMTPITITGDDGPGSGTKEIWYQIYYPNGTLYTEPDKPGDFTLYTGPIHVSGPDGMYHIYYKAMDHLGNVEQLRKQRFILDNDFPLGDQSQMWFTPSPAEVDTGTSGTIEIAINASTPLSGLQCSLSFNPAMIRIDAIEVALPINSSGTIDNVNGTVTGIFGIADGDNISATQTFATIHFTARNYTGDTTVTLTEVVALDEDDNPVTVLAWPGTITVTGAPPSCPYDINGDDVVNILDIMNVSAMLGWHGPAGGIPQDVSGPQGIPDGEVNIFDIVALARHWGPCP